MFIFLFIAVHRRSSALCKSGRIFLDIQSMAELYFSLNKEIKTSRFIKEVHYFLSLRLLTVLNAYLCFSNSSCKRILPCQK